MVVNDDAFFLSKRVALETIASKLAPTGFCVNLQEQARSYNSKAT